MNLSDNSTVDPEQTVTQPQGTDRRQFIKAGLAVAGGIALSTTYVKPRMLSVEVHETAYASSEANRGPTLKDGPIGRPKSGTTGSAGTKPPSASTGPARTSSTTPKLGQDTAPPPPKGAQ